MNLIASNLEPLITANTSTNGTSGVVSHVYSALQETYVEAIDFQSVGTNAATVARVFLSKGDRSVASNNVLWKQFTLASTTASQTAAPAAERKAINEFIPAGMSLFVAIGTAGTDGWRINLVGGNGYIELQ
jgi:hypothetical protein